MYINMCLHLSIRYFRQRERDTHTHSDSLSDRQTGQTVVEVEVEEEEDVYDRLVQEGEQAEGK